MKNNDGTSGWRHIPRWLGVAAILAILGASAYAAYLARRIVTVDVPNAYAVEWVTEMVVEYMRSHNDQWPKKWEDLREAYETLAKPQNYPWSFDDLRNRVAVDWLADPVELRKAKQEPNRPPFRVIWLKDGSQTQWENSEPNTRILEYLKTRDLLPGSS